MIKIVVFDMDGVLYRYRIERRLARLASWSGQSPEAIYAAIWRSGFEDEAECGLLSADDYHGLYGVEEEGESVGRNGVIERWSECEPLPGTAAQGENQLADS